MRDNLLLGLIGVFVPYSLISIGGGASIIAGVQQAVVNERGWLSASQFIEIFAVSRAAPGPGTMFATLIGWTLAGWSGALVATLALFLPSALVCYTVFRLSNAHRQRPWHRAMREGLAPVGTGLIIAAVISILRITGGQIFAVITALGAAALMIVFPRFPPIVIIAGNGLITWALHTYALSGL